jgi:hypothetical protein
MGTANVFFSEYEILLDTEASINIFSNRDILTKISSAAIPTVMHGVHKGAPGVKVTEQGDFLDLGSVYWSGESAANILSFGAQVEAGANISYDQLTDSFNLAPKDGYNNYVFSRKPISGSGGKFYCCDVRHFIDATVLIQTVEENLKQFSAREIAQAKKARELLCRMSFYPKGDQYSRIRQELQRHCIGFLRGRQNLGESTASIKGKTTRQKAIRADSDDLTTITVQQTQTLYIDIMFVDKVPMLLGVAHPLDLTLTASLLNFDTGKLSRATASISAGVDSFINALKSRNFNVKVFFSDGEATVTKLIPDLNEIGIEVDVCAAGSHVPIAERRIRVVKESVRAYMSHHLPYSLPTIGIIMCVMFCVSRITFQLLNDPTVPAPEKLSWVEKPTTPETFAADSEISYML